MKKLIYFISMILSFSSCGVKSAEKKEMKAEDIIKLINKGKDVQLNDKIILDDLDFTQIKKKYIASTHGMEAYIDVNIAFFNCVFMGNVTALGTQEKLKVSSSFSKNVTFFDCDFRSDFSFRNASIYGMLECPRSVFRGEADFNSINVKGSSVNFVEMEAEKGFNFVYANVGGNLNFKDAQFKSDANFLGLRADKIMFGNAKFAGIADFSNSIFFGDVIFNYTEFSENAQFSFSKYLGTFDIIQSDIKGSLTLERSYFYGGMKLNRLKAKSVVTKNAYTVVKPLVEDLEIENDTFNINLIETKIFNK